MPRNAPGAMLRGLARSQLRYGQAEQAASRCAEARAIYENTAASFPWHLDANNQLAWFLATCPVESFRDPERALRFAEKAVARDFSNGGHYTGTLGVAQYRLGDYRSAVATLDRATRLNHGRPRPEHLFFQSMAQWRLGNKEAARNDYD